MSHVKHELAEEFPLYVDRLHELKVSNTHFRRISDLYHDLNRAIHRAETEIEPTTDDNLENMKKQRLALKDEIYTFLKNG